MPHDRKRTDVTEQGLVRHGFTLLEMSIVLVIIALLAAGVVIGQDLMRIALITRVASEANSMRTALTLFKDKYREWPGDSALATQYFGAATQNGDGNDHIFADNAGGGEHLRVWQHLAMAGLLNGEYTGLPGLPCPYVPGRNIPAAAYGEDGGYVLWDNAGAPLMIDDRHTEAKYLVLGARLADTACSWAMVGGLLRPWEGRSLDQKMDDGVASGGSVMGLTGTTRDLTPFPDEACGTTVLNTPAADYMESAGSGLCLMVFLVVR